MRRSFAQPDSSGPDLGLQLFPARSFLSPRSGPFLSYASRVRIVVHEESFPERPAFDTAVSRALLLAVGEGRSPAALRLYEPGDAVAFSLLDSVQPGFREAVAAARALGFDAMLRLAGGRVLAGRHYFETGALARALAAA